MPTVPTSFVPQVAPQGGGDIGQFQAPQVAVAENLAAAQQVRFGAAMTAAGNQVFRLGSAIQDGIDEAQAKAADIAFLQQANAILRGQQGYLRTSGKDAETTYASTMDALSQAGQSALDSLQNDTQKAMFKTPLARNMMTFQSQALDHRDREVKVFYANESKFRAEQYITLALDDYKNFGTPNSNYEINRGVAINEYQQEAIARGIPRESAQFREITRAVDTQLTAGVVNRLMLNNDFQEARDVVDAQRKAGNLTLKEGEALIQSVDAAHDRFMVPVYANRIRKQSTVDPIDPSEPDNPPDGLRGQLGIVDDSDLDPGMKEMVKARLRTDFAQETALRQQEYNALKDSVEQFLAIPGNTPEMIDGLIWRNLLPTDQQFFMEADRKNNDLAAEELLAREPWVLTREWLEKHRGDFTRKTYIKYLNDLNDPAKIGDASLEADQLNATLIRNNLESLANPKSDTSRTESLQLRDMLKTQIDQRQAELRRQLSRSEKQTLMDQVIMQYGETVYQRDWFFDNAYRASTVKPEDVRTMYVKVDGVKVDLWRIPQSWIVNTALPGFRAEGQNYPTMKQIADLWLRQGKPSE